MTLRRFSIENLALGSVLLLKFPVTEWNATIRLTYLSVQNRHVTKFKKIMKMSNQAVILAAIVMLGCVADVATKYDGFGKGNPSNPIWIEVFIDLQCPCMSELSPLLMPL
jgi:hypothetical protein